MQCICQRVIKHAYFFYNKQTKQTISVGSTCKNKFMKIEKELNHPILKMIFTNAISRGEYKIINDCLEYASDIQEEVINHIQFKLDIATTSLKLNELKAEVKHLIDDYKIDYLGEVFGKIENKLAILIKQQDEARQKIKAEEEERKQEYKLKEEQRRKLEEEYQINIQRREHNADRNQTDCLLVRIKNTVYDICCLCNDSKAGYQVSFVASVRYRSVICTKPICWKCYEILVNAHTVIFDNKATISIDGLDGVNRVITI